MSHAIIFSSSSGLFMILWMNVTGRRPHVYENVGALVITLGIVMLLLDGGKAKTTAGSDVVLGDMMALLASLFAFWFFSSMRKIQIHICTLDSITLVYSLQTFFYTIIVPSLSLILSHTLGTSILSFTEALSWVTDPWTVV